MKFLTWSWPRCIGGWATEKFLPVSYSVHLERPIFDYSGCSSFKVIY